MLKLLYVDCETTGLNPVIHDIVQISGIIEINGEEKETFNLFCQPISYRNISSEALRINGRTLEELKTFPTSEKTFGDFVKMLNKYVSGNLKDRFALVGHNVQFDNGFIKSWFAKMGYDSYAFSKFIDYRTIDTMCLNFLLKHLGLIDTEEIKLEKLANIYGVPIQEAHNSLYDIKATKNIMNLYQKVFIKKPSEIDLSILSSDCPLYFHLLRLQQEEKHQKYK